MTAPPLALYDEALAGTKHSATLYLAFADGTRERVPFRDWRTAHLAGDETLVQRCAGPTLDVGCGPGRLVAALGRQGVPALGIDISAESHRQTVQRGGAALQRDVFARVPARGRWHAVLLADGNIGIGGHPERLLRRCGALVRPGGQVHVEAQPAGRPTRCGAARLESGDRVSGWFGWAQLGLADVVGAAAGANLAVTETWSASGRWFATLRRGW